MKNNKSLTVTYHRSMNYGASLQAYALQQTLFKKRNDNKLIDFDYSAWSKVFPIKGFKSTLIKLYSNFSYLIHLSSFKRRKKRFDNFCNHYLKLTKKYSTIKDIEADYSNKVSFVLTGSDQVFSLRNSSFTNDINLLRFSINCKKYSYAASFSSYDLTSEEKEDFKKAFQSFSCISVREKKGQEMLFKLGINESMINIDPVFLLSKESWMNLVSKRIVDYEYILYYQVNSNPISNECIKKIKKETGLPVICLQTNYHKTVKADKYVFDAGPLEFLSLLFYSSFVITTSFHGTAFSIIFNKDFYVLTKKTSNPYRIIELLNNTCLIDRLVDDVNDVSVLKRIDWNLSNEKILEEVRKSDNYLNSICFEGIDND